MITVAAGEVRANRWAPGVLLNGADFVESLLEIGDRLAIGPYLFELAVADEGTYAPPRRPAQPTKIVAAATPRAESASASSDASPDSAKQVVPPSIATETHVSFEDRLLVRLWSRNRANQTRVQKLAQRLRDATEALADADRRRGSLADQFAAAQEESVVAQATISRLQQRLETVQSNAAATTTDDSEQIARLEADLEKAHGRASGLAKQVKALEAELAQLAATRAAADDATVALANAEASIALHETRFAALQADLDHARTDVHSARQTIQSLQQREAELQAELDALKDVATNVQQSVAASTDQETYKLQLADVAAERDVAHQLVAEREEQLRQLAGELEEAREKLLRAESAVAAQHSAADELDQVRASLVERLEHSQAACEAAQAEAQAAAARADESVGEQESLRREIEQLQEQLSNVQQERLVEAAQSVPPVASSSTDSIASSDEDGLADEVIARLRSASLWKDDPRESVQDPPGEAAPPSSSHADEAGSFYERYRHVLDDEGSEETTEPLPPLPPSPKSSDESHAADDDDAALQAYMENMLRRMRGEPSASAEQLRRGDPPDPSSDVPPPPVEVHLTRELERSPVPAPDSAERPEPTELIDLDELKRSTKKPALPADLSAMRELANTSARTAIAKHRRRRLIEAAMGRFTLGSIAIGLAIFMMLSAEWIGASNFILGAVIAVGGSWATGTVAAFVISELAEQLRMARARKIAEAYVARNAAKYDELIED